MLQKGREIKMFNFPEIILLSDDFQPIAEMKFFINNQNQVVTFPLSSKQGLTFFYPEQEVFFEFKDNEQLNLYHLMFNEMKEQNDRIHYVFDIVLIKPIYNNRKEKRNPVLIEAIYTESNFVNHATILDLSKHGMKIKTDKPIYDQYIDIYFEKGFEKKVAYGRIVWDNENDGSYYYGLSLYTNEEVV